MEKSYVSKNSFLAKKFPPTYFKFPRFIILALWIFKFPFTDSKVSNELKISSLIVTFNTALDFYLNMVVEFKDNKIRVQIFDDGNVYKPGSYSGSTYISGISARTYRVKSYFSDGMIIYKPKPGMLNINEKNAPGSLYYKASIVGTFNEIETFINAKVDVKKEDSGW